MTFSRFVPIRLTHPLVGLCLFAGMLISFNAVHAENNPAASTAPNNQPTATATAPDPVAALPSAPETTPAATPTSTVDTAATESPAGAPPATTASESSTDQQSQSTPPSSSAAKSQPREINTEPESLQAAVTRLKLKLPLPKAHIVVTKSRRRLDLYSGKTLVKSYTVALGANPVGAKRSQGDKRTPEGQFYICTRNATNSAFHIFLGLSYPALPDATRAVNHKAITWREYQVIRQRLASRGAPLWSTRLGGWVGIHGGTDAPFAQRRMQERGSHDWTAGCIAVTNHEIEEIYRATRLGTPVLVRP
jgi:hypothetical protein